MAQTAQNKHIENPRFDETTARLSPFMKTTLPPGSDIIQFTRTCSSLDLFDLDASKAFVTLGLRLLGLPPSTTTRDRPTSSLKMIECETLLGDSFRQVFTNDCVLRCFFGPLFWSSVA
jgi:hypothetical protein